MRIHNNQDRQTIEFLAGIMLMSNVDNGGSRRSMTFAAFAIIPFKTILFIPGTLKDVRRTKVSAWTHLRRMRIRIAMHVVMVVSRTYTIFYVMMFVNFTIEEIGIAYVATRAYLLHKRSRITMYLIYWQRWNTRSLICWPNVDNGGGRRSITFRAFAVIPFKMILFIPGTLKDVRRTQVSAWTHLRRMRIRIATHVVTVVSRTYTIF